MFDPAWRLVDHGGGGLDLDGGKAGNARGGAQKVSAASLFCHRCSVCNTNSTPEMSRLDLAFILQVSTPGVSNGRKKHGSLRHLSFPQRCGRGGGTPAIVWLSPDRHLGALPGEPRDQRFRA